MDTALPNDYVPQTLMSHFSWGLFAQEEATKQATNNVLQNDYVHTVVTSHFAWGLALGLLLVLFTWLSGLAKSREARREVRRLREHLNTQMDITQRGNASMKLELDTLKSQNENLRVQVREWQTKPGRGELRQLAVYDRAIRILNQNAPGFSPVWEKAVKESEEEIAATDTGVSSVLRRAFRPFAALGNGTRTEKPAGGAPFDEHSGPASTPE